MDVRYIKSARVIALVMLAGSATSALASSLHGTLDYNLAIRTADGNVQKSELILTPRWDSDLSDSARLTLIARGRFDAVDELSPGQPPQHARSHLNRRAYLGNNADFELREFYIDTTIDDLYVRLGKQQMVWGQADGLKVVDVLNPVDYREFILPEVDERRIPLWMINTEAPLGAGMLQLILIPDQSYDEIPPFDGEFAFSSRLVVPSAPQNTPVNMHDHDRPGRPLKDGDAGVRWQTFLGGWDLGVNYFYHYHDQAVFYLSHEQTGVVVSPEFERSHLLGGTLSNAFGDYAVRGELAYSTHRYWVADPARVAEGVTFSPELAYVVGLDYSGISDTFISLQLFQSHLTERERGTVRAPTETQVTALVRHSLWNEALMLKAFAIQSMDDDDGLLQLEARYQFTSELSGRVGADLFYGDRTGLFGQFRNANRLHAGFTYAF